MSRRVLLVEADAILGAVLSEVLRHNGYEVVLVRTLINDEIEHIDSMNAVILDIDTTSAEKELGWLDARPHEDESLPIVLMGLQAPQELHYRLGVHRGFLEANALTLVKKPFRNEELLAAVRQAHEGRWPEQANGK